MKSYIQAFVVLVSLSCFAQQEETVWDNFISAKESGDVPILPDFSYAGYKYCEVPIPNLNYRVFDVTDFGAIVNDDKSDKDAIKQAIAAATLNGEGVIFFPRGKYLINTIKDELNSIEIASSNIVFRGEFDGETGTILFFDRDLPAADPTKIWTCPPAIKTTTNGKNRLLTNIIADSNRESYIIEVEDASSIKKNDWIILKVLNNEIDLISYDVAPLVVESEWKSILNDGVQVNERHKVDSISGNTVFLKEPIHYDIQADHNWEVYSFAHESHIGFENIRFEGNWTKKFVHHRSAQDDGGWSILDISKAVDSWIIDCTFKNVNNAASFSSSASCTALNIKILGNIGHTALHAGNGSTGILFAKINDLAGMYHTTGVAGGSTTGTVVWRSKHPTHTSFGLQGSQPRCTLFDNVEGGFFAGRGGGKREYLPNHGRYLVLWNYNETDDADENFNFVASETWSWKIVPPIIVGFHGSGTTFKKDEIQVLESLGTPVAPESLFEAQLDLRLGGLPEWISEVKKLTLVKKAY